MKHRPVVMLASYLIVIGVSQEITAWPLLAGIPLYALAARSSPNPDGKRFATYLGLGVLYISFVTAVNLGSLLTNPAYLRALGVPIVGSIFLIFFSLVGDAYHRAQLVRAFIVVQLLLAMFYLGRTLGLYSSLLGYRILRPEGTVEGLLGRNHTTAFQLAIASILLLCEIRTRADWRRSGRRPSVLSLAMGRESTYRLVAMVALLVVVLASTRSRGYTLGFVVAVVVIGMSARPFMRRPSVLFWSLIAGATSSYVIWDKLAARVRSGLAEDNDFSIRVRFGLWDRALSMISESPLVGYGVGGFQATSAESGGTIAGRGLVRTIRGGAVPQRILQGEPDGGLPSHNAVLQILLDGGVVWLLFVLAAAVVVIRVARQNPDRVELRALMVFMLVGGVTGSFSIYLVSGSWMLAALAFGENGRSDERPHDELSVTSQRGSQRHRRRELAAEVRA